MENDVLQMVYGLWVNSEDYRKNSALENECYEKTKEKAKGIVGESVYNKISDEVLGLACEAELAGFDNGFRYGIMFMTGMLKGGAKA